MDARRFSALVLCSLLLAGDAPSGAAPVYPLSGERRLLVLLVRPADGPPGPITSDEARQRFFEGPESLSAFFKEVSYGALTVSGDVRGWFSLPIPCAGYEELLTAAVDAASATGSLAGFDDLLLYYPYVPGCAAGRPQASRRRREIGTPGTMVSLTVAWVPDGYPPEAAWHELGHNLGLQHARRLTCPDGVIDALCTVLEYGDWFDVLGDLHGQFGAHHREQLEWLAPSIPAPNSCVAVRAIEQPSGVRAIKVLAETSGRCRRWYYVEYRRPIGFDAFIASFAPSVTNAVLVHGGDDCGSPSDLAVVAGVTGPFGELGAGSSAFLDGEQSVVLSTESTDDDQALVCLRRFEIGSAWMRVARDGGHSRFAVSGALGFVGPGPSGASPAGSWSVRLSSVVEGVPSRFFAGSIPALSCNSARVCSGVARDRSLALGLFRGREEGTWRFRIRGQAAFDREPASGGEVIRLELCSASETHGCVGGNMRFVLEGERLVHPRRGRTFSPLASALPRPAPSSASSLRASRVPRAGGS